MPDGHEGHHHEFQVVHATPEQERMIYVTFESIRPALHILGPAYLELAWKMGHFPEGFNPSDGENAKVAVAAAFAGAQAAVTAIVSASLERAERMGASETHLGQYL